MSHQMREQGSVGFFLVLVLLGVAILLPEPGFGQQPPRKTPPRKAPAKTAATAAPTPSAAQPKFKGIWEPVNYSEDLQLADIFCVSAEVCYVSGYAGTILKTTDGGQSWTPQLGGDPQGKESHIYGLLFLDETHGWAIQFRDQLLRTTDGETWERVGKIGRLFSPSDYLFVSEDVGFVLENAGAEPTPSIARTLDGGRTWQQVAVCSTKMQIQGLMRDVECRLRSLYFVSPTVGYAVGGMGEFLFTMKTEDGGETWTVFYQDKVGSGSDPGFEILGGGDLFFIDENTGFVSLRSGRILATTDGGQTWRGLVGTAGWIRFADPEVGFSFLGAQFTYTTDGGKRWNSRPIRFPAGVHAFSLPRRDRAYVVGNHGMIYRYRVVPATEEVAANAIPAPAMPLLDSPLDEQVEELDSEVEALEKAMAEAPTPEAAPAEGQTEAGAEAPTQEAAPAEGQAEASSEEPGWVDKQYSDKVEQIETTLEAVTAEVPKFTGKYRNLNLILAGLQMVGQLFGQAQSLKDSFQALRQARDPKSAMAALTELTAQVDAIKQSTKAAFQKPVQQEE